jgi:hypothetical protein
MQNHPLFNTDKNIEFLNIRHATGSNKWDTLTDQWQPEQIQTPLDLFEAVGQVEGRYELIGRGKNHAVVERVELNIKAPIGFCANPQQQAVPTPQAQQQQSGSPGMMTAPGGLLIPANIDPSMAMVISMMALGSQQSAANQQQMQQMMQHSSTQLVTMMQANQQAQMQASQNTMQLVGQIASTVVPALMNRGVGGDVAGAQGAAEAGFIKGVEVLAAMREGVDKATSAGTTDWSAVSANIMQGLRSLSEIAKATAAPAPAAAPPVVPPGGPTA